jgi:GT2 family glycosyltransferase
MLSIIVPTIRTDKWRQLYNSIRRSTAYDFELILVGPRYSPALEEYKNVRFIQDYGSPNRAQQIGLCNAVGHYALAAADDCIFEVGSLDECIDILADAADRTVVIAKYSEGSTELQNDDYYLLNKAYPNVSSVENDWVIFNCAIMETRLLKNLGGFDCRFQTTAFGHADLAVRAQQEGYDVVFYKKKLLHCEHGHSDHVPIEITHVYEDTPAYIEKHNKPSFENRYIRLDNWKNAPTVWSKR